MGVGGTGVGAGVSGAGVPPRSPPENDEETGGVSLGMRSKASAVADGTAGGGSALDRGGVGAAAAPVLGRGCASRGEEDVAAAGAGRPGEVPERDGGAADVAPLRGAAVAGAASVGAAALDGAGGDGT